MLDLTLGPSFKVKRWFTGFGLFGGYKFASVVRCVGLVFNALKFMKLCTKSLIFSLTIAGIFFFRLHICTSPLVDNLVAL